MQNFAGTNNEYHGIFDSGLIRYKSQISTRGVVVAIRSVVTVLFEYLGWWVGIAGPYVSIRIK